MTLPDVLETARRLQLSPDAALEYIAAAAAGADEEFEADAFWLDAVESALRRKRIDTRAQARAAKAGLTSWPLLVGNRVPAAELVPVEKVLCQEHLLCEQPTTEYGAYWRLQHPVQGEALLDAKEALCLARLAGPDTARLAKLLRGWIVGLRPAGAASTGERFSVKRLHWVETALAWVAAHYPHLTRHLAVPTLAVLGRLPEQHRWPLLTGHQAEIPTAMLWPRQLNLAMLRQAQRSPQLRFQCLPQAVQWQRLTGHPRPANLKLPSLVGFKVKTLKALAVEFQVPLDGANHGTVRGLLPPVVNLVRLFGDVGAIRRFVAAAGFGWSAKGLHDAGQFTLPAGADWTPAKWAPLCLRHPQAVARAGNFPALEARGDFPASLAQLNRAVRLLGYPEIPAKWQALADVCLANDLPAAEFETNRRFWDTVQVKPAEFLPHVDISGDSLGLPPGWRFWRLPADSYLGPMLGRLTGCCQHLDGAGRSCAAHGVTSPFSAFYVVTHHDKVIAQSWCWLNKQGGLVIDSVESRLREASQLGPVLALYQAGVHQMLKSSLPVPAVYVGLTGAGITTLVRQELTGEARARKTGQIVTTAPAQATAPADGCAYYDGDTHVLVAGKHAARAKRALPRVTGYRPAAAPPRSAHLLALGQMVVPDYVLDEFGGRGMWDEEPVWLARERYRI